MLPVLCKEGKVILVQTYIDPEDSRRLRLGEFSIGI